MLATRTQTRFGAARRASVPAAGSSSAVIRRAPLALPQVARAPCTRGLRIPTASAASAAPFEVPAYPTPEAKQQDVNAAGAPGFLKQMLTNVVKFVSLGAMALVMAMAQPSAAMASSSGRSGGRVGGFSGSSMSRSSSMSSPASTYSSSRTVIVQSTPTVSFGFMPVMPFGFGGYGYGYSSSGGIVTLLLVVFMIWAAVSIFRNFSRSDDEAEYDEYGEEVLPMTVTKLQVGLLSSARHIKEDLNKLAERADTSRPEGLQMVLQETMLSLLRNPEYCVYADATSEVVRSPEEAEQRFSTFSLQERSKIGQETLTNYSGMSRNGASFARTSLTDVDELLVVTIMVAAEADVQIPRIRTANDLKQALSALGGVSASQVMGVELLWTPQAEADFLTRDDVMRDYPNLVPL